MNDSAVSPLPPPSARECRTRASLLLEAIRGDDPAQQRAAAERLRILPAFAAIEPDKLVAERERVRRKHALAVIATELGFDSWVALKAAIAASDVPRADAPRTDAGLATVPEQ